MKLLARRDFASLELRSQRESLGFEREAIDSSVAALTAERALDDARFAENYVAYHASRGQGPVRIAAALQGLGLPAPLIDAALAAGRDWSALARAARVRRFGSREPRTWPQKARQARFLQYRGFSSDHIRFALDTDSSLDE